MESDENFKWNDEMVTGNQENEIWRNYMAIAKVARVAKHDNYVDFNIKLQILADHSIDVTMWR